MANFKTGFLGKKASRWLFALVFFFLSDHHTFAQLAERVRKIVILAGRKSHGPVGNGIHDYGWSAKLLKMMLENSNIKDRVRVEIHHEGWPRDEKSLEDADTIMVISDGRDGALFEEAPHLANEERIRLLDRLMKRGCGFMTFHFSTFAPEKYRDRVLEWAGGYFQWETDGKRQWYSAITTTESDVKLASPQHAILRGVTPFKMREEFYYNLRFDPADKAWTPLLEAPNLKGREPDGKVVAWAKERSQGGRSFGTTAGHFYDNWRHPEFRTLILNALAWTAKVEVPTSGVQAKFFSHDEIRQHLGEPAEAKTEEPIRVLMFAGNEAHRWHHWPKTVTAIKTLLEADPRLRVDVSLDIEDLSRKKLQDYQALVLNYCNWHDPLGLSEKSKKAFVEYLKEGGGLVAVHFANGAFHFSLPMAGGSDWPEYRKIIRRVWNHHGKGERQSGHDPFGSFQVNVKADEPLAKGLKAFEVTDELYFRQDGDEPIEPFLSAKSRVTGKEEPLAWKYHYGKGKVVQTLLGHSEKTYDTFEPREILRRAVAWAAGREIRPVDPKSERRSAPDTAPGSSPLAEGKFGKAFRTAGWGGFVPGKAEYRTFPLTVECWAKLGQKQSYNILLAHELKSSATHWEIFSLPGSGKVAAYLPGFSPDHVYGTTDIADGQWHHVGLILEPTRARLVVDGKTVGDQKILFSGRKTVPGRLALGILDGREIGCTGMIDDIRLRQGTHEITVPAKELMADADTVGLWKFEGLDHDHFLDDSKLRNHAKLEKHQAAPPTQSMVVPAGPQMGSSDPRFETVLIDRSEKDAYLAVRVDSQGQLFVAAREAIYRFDPAPGGKFQPRKEILKFPADSILMGLEYRGNDLYVLTANALYLIPDGRVKTSGLQPRRILWGLPLDLHVSFHCLAWGPEGDLYVNHGDPLLNFGDWNHPDHWGHWTLFAGPRGTPIPYTGAGAVLRMKPDGSDVRVVAGGLRGPVGLAFDKHWNLFTNDNDHESRADLYAPCRLFHVTPNIDFAWPRGWMASKAPNRKDLVEPLHSSMGRGVPCDLIYLDEPAFPKEIRHNLIMQRWDRLTMNRYPLERRGASFQADELVFLQGQNHARPVNVCVDRTGRIFGSALFLTGNVWSPHCPSDVFVTRLRQSAQPVEKEFLDLVQAAPAVLWAELSSPSWERRSRAHAEIIRRGNLSEGALARLAEVRDEDPALHHLPWLAIGANQGAATKAVEALAMHSLETVRLQAVRIFATHLQLNPSAEVMAHALSDPSPAVQLAALGYFFEAKRAPPWQRVETLAASDDPYLRQTAAKLLAVRASQDRLDALLESSDSRKLLAGTLAAGFRLTIPGSHQIPPKSIPLEYTSGNAHFKLRFADVAEEVDLKKHARIGSFTMARWWEEARKHGEAALPTEHEADGRDFIEKRHWAGKLQKVAERDDAVASQQAAYFLGLIGDTRAERKLAKQRLDRIFQKGDAVRISQAWILGPFPKSVKIDSPPERQVIDLSAPVLIGKSSLAWKLGDPSARQGSTYIYLRLQARQRQMVGLDLANATNLHLWINGKATPGSTDESARFLMELQPGSNDLLIRCESLPTPELAPWRMFTTDGATALVPEKLDGALLAQRLRDAGKSGEKIEPEFLTKDWHAEVKSGNVEAGRKLFGSLGCVKCHAIAGTQEGGGAPNLAEAKKRFTVPYLVESVLLPSKQVGDAFRSSQITTKQGLILTGLVVRESSESLELLLGDTTRRMIPRADIEERAHTPLSPMPAGLVKTPAELRDLLAYLLGDNPTPP